MYLKHARVEMIINRREHERQIGVKLPHGILCYMTEEGELTYRVFYRKRLAHRYRSLAEACKARERLLRADERNKNLRSLPDTKYIYESNSPVKPFRVCLKIDGKKREKNMFTLESARFLRDMWVMERDGGIGDQVSHQKEPPAECGESFDTCLGVNGLFPSLLEGALYSFDTEMEILHNTGTFKGTR